MYCPKCGKENPDDAQFCNSCNSKLPEASQTTEGVNVRVSSLAIISLICALCGVVLLAPSCIAVNYPRVISTRSQIYAVTVLLSFITLGVALILGFISIIQVESSGGRTTGRNFAVGAVLISVFGGFLPMWMISLQRTRSVAFRMVCGTNLSRIGKAMLIYSNDYDDELPRAGGKSSTWAAKISNWKADNQTDAYNLNKDGSGGQASISSSFFLLVKYAEITPKSFVCNKDSKTKEFKTARYSTDGKHLIDLWDFGPEPWKHCSYSYHMPYGLYALTTSCDPALAVASERNPWIDSPFIKAKKDFSKFDPEGGTESIKAGNAIAHQEDGQNVLFLDSHVSFEKHSFCGINDDNIYTYWDGGDIRRGSRPKLGSQPRDRLDSLLVHDPPVTDQK
ncbi:MAG: zinc-ribbon domain-containing protein [Planctomycetota bacterium]|jgi:hypothetical protein